jgi:hypothetical protein
MYKYFSAAGGKVSAGRIKVGYSLTSSRMNGVRSGRLQLLLSVFVKVGLADSVEEPSQ